MVQIKNTLTGKPHLPARAVVLTLLIFTAFFSSVAQATEQSHRTITTSPAHNTTTGKTTTSHSKANKPSPAAKKKKTSATTASSKPADARTAKASSHRIRTTSNKIRSKKIKTAAKTVSKHPATPGKNSNKSVSVSKRSNKKTAALVVRNRHSNKPECHKHPCPADNIAELKTTTASGEGNGTGGVRVHKAKKTAMTKLMKQLGKPYRWGGSSPATGFDCSGLVYFAYKDLVNFHIPRTANEMYHLRDAASVSRNELKKGDLVFFRTEGRAIADHVGVYIGDNKFIQSPRAGQDVQIASLNENYWQRHYVGARRIVTPKTVR